jgi:hypothetical protein
VEIFSISNASLLLAEAEEGGVGKSTYARGMHADFIFDFLRFLGA